MHRRLVVWATLTAALAAAPALLAAPPAHANWSAPAQLRGCASALSGAPPLVVFPSSAPSVRSGPGMVLWEGGAACGGTGGVGVAAPQALTAPIEADGLPGAGRALRAVGAGLASVAAAVGTTFGQVLVAGVAGDTGAYAEARAPAAFSPPHGLDGPPSPVATYGGYLGDAVLASPVRARGGGWALEIRVQRHYASTPNRVWRLPTGGRPSAVAVTMDYRSDVLAVWAAHGTIAAQEITQAGVVVSTEVLGAVAGVPELRALFSDDGRAIVAWRSQREATTTIDVNISGPDLSFGPPALVERFRDLPGLPPPRGSLQLTRMSSEAVMMAWTGRSAGRYVVRASPVSLRRGVWAPVTISGTPRGREALLAALVPGPRAEVLALWVSVPRLPDGTLAAGRRAIVAAWGHYGGHGEAQFAMPETVAPPGPNGTPAAAFDPDSDRALAAWTTGLGTARPRIVYAQRTPGPPAAIARDLRPAPKTGGDGIAPLFAALVLLALALAGALVAIVRRRARQASIDSSAMRIGTPFAAWRK